MSGTPQRGIESFTEQRWITIRHSGRPTYPF